MISDLDLAAIAAQAYKDPPTWRGRGLEGEDVHAIRVDRGGATVIAFRGSTLDPADWFRDLHACTRYREGLGLCHAGFLAGVASIERQIRDSLYPLPVGYRAGGGLGLQLVITGHSLGGALALIMGGVLCAAGLPPASIVTFGAPRAGFPKLGRVLRAGVPRLVQYRNGNDPIPAVPPAWLAYRHATRLTPTGGLHAWPSIGTHRIAAYIDALRLAVHPARPPDR